MLIQSMTVVCSDAEIVKNADGTVAVTLHDPSHDDLLGAFEIRDLIDHYADDDLFFAHLDKDNAEEFYGFMSNSFVSQIEDENDELKRKLEEFEPKCYSRSEMMERQIAPGVSLLTPNKKEGGDGN